MPKPPFDYSLYLVTDQGLCRRSRLVDVIAQAIDGGVSVVQLREKQLATREFVRLARQVRELIKPRNVPLFINDRVDVALAAEADGIHVGQEDMEVMDVRKLVGDTMAVGLSVNTEAEVLEANQLPVDYLGLGPIFPTSTKADAKTPLGCQGLRRLRSLTEHPLVAIGSLSMDNAAEVVRAGADGLAVVSAICATEDPRAAAAELKRCIEAARTS
jgi:thiamine-phosphate pyrophosphorylase